MLQFYAKSLCVLVAAVALSLLMGPDGLFFDYEIIISLRLPRVLVALFCGAATAVAGGLSQSLFKNSLATPSVIGTESGAACALALGVLTAGPTQLAWPFLWALSGALAATMFALILARIEDLYPVSALLIGGFAINALMASVTSLCVTVLMERGDGLSLYHWLLGNFSARTWTHVILSGSGFVLLSALALRGATKLDLLSIGTKSAGSLGIHVPRLRIVIISLIGGLTATSISCGGALPFVGLIAPHLFRQRGITRNRELMVAAAIYGGIITVVSDLLARTIRAPIDTDVGLITAIIGAPYFLRVLWTQAKRGHTT